MGARDNAFETRERRCSGFLAVPGHCRVTRTSDASSVWASTTSLTTNASGSCRPLRADDYLRRGRREARAVQGARSEARGRPGCDVLQDRYDLRNSRGRSVVESTTAFAAWKTALTSTWQMYGRPVCGVVSVLFTRDRRVFFRHVDGTTPRRPSGNATRCSCGCSPGAINATMDTQPGGGVCREHDGSRDGCGLPPRRSPHAVAHD